MSTEDRNLGPLLIILIVLLVALGANYTREGKWGEILGRFGIEFTENLTLIEPASPGQVVEEFPLELLWIVQDTKVIESGLYKDRQGREVLMTAYTTKAPVSDVFAGYLNFLVEHEYDVESADAKSGVALIWSQSDKWRTLIQIELKSAGVSEVRVSARRTVVE
jgi:hypothetical protein